MRGGKRDGAGRKGYGPTKTYRLPIALEPEITALLEKYKEKHDQSKEEKPAFDSVTKSKEPTKPRYPVLSKDQIKRLQDWLVKHNRVKSKTEARRLTKTPKLCQETFMEHNLYVKWNGIEDIAKLYPTSWY